MNGLAAVYGNHLGAQLLGLATAAAERTPRSGAPRPPSPSAPNASTPSKRWLPEQPQEDAQEEEEYEDEIIEEMSGNWAPGTNPNSTTTTSQAVPRVDSVEWTKMEEGPDDETQLTEPAEDDDPQVLRTLKRKRKSLDDKDLKDEKGTAGGAEQLPPGKKRLSCIDCGCRAALKACSKVMCIDCCPKEGRVCNAHAKKLYEKEVRKLDQPTGTEKEPHGKDKEGSGKQSAKKRSRVRALSGDGGEQEDDFSFGGEGGGGGEEESDGTLGDRGADRNGDAVAGDEGEERGAKAKRSILYETIAKQDKKIRALQNDLKELRTLLLSVVDKQTAFSRQLRHISGHSDGLVIDEDDEGDEDGS